MKGKEKGKTGKRYTQAEKKRVLDFINSQGRGGIAAAQKKFGVSYIAVRRWMTGTRGAHGYVKNKSAVPADIYMRIVNLEKFQRTLKRVLAKL